MKEFGWCRVGAFWRDEDAWASYYREVLEHAGIPYSQIPKLLAAELAKYDVLLLCGVGEVLPQIREALEKWVEAGGALVCSGSAWGVEALLGLASGTKRLSRDRLKAEGPDRLWAEGMPHVTVFGASAHLPASAKIVAQFESGPVGISRRNAGKGLGLFLAPHIGQAIALMQLGRSVEVDAVGPTDGFAMLDDGVLRAEDGTALDFERDRSATEEAGVPVFLHSHADAVREIWIRAIVEAAEHTGKPLPILWHWPRNAPFGAMLTVDCEDRDPESLSRLLRVLSMFGCRAAWLVPQAGFTLDVVRSLRVREQELGLLYNVDKGHPWSPEQFKSQHLSLSRVSATADLLSVRAVDGKWQRWTSFYEMAEQAGARISLSKGGRQPGTSGFLFGTCHPFFPQRKDGSSHWVLEVPYSVYLPGHVTPDAAAEALLAQTEARHGVYHIATTSGIEGALSMNSLRKLLSLCKQRRGEFLRPDEAYAFERGRRSLKTFFRAGPDGGALILASDQELSGLTVLLTSPGLSVSLHGKYVTPSTVERYGATLAVVTMNLVPKQQAEIVLSTGSEVIAA